MDLLNIFLLILIGIYVLHGFHKGFLVSLGNTIGMVVSWIVGFIFSPLLAETISKGAFYRYVLVFTEGSSFIQNPLDGHLDVSTLSSSQISQIVGDANLPFPFSDILQENMSTLAFSDLPGTDYNTVNAYFDYTVTNVVVNICAFLIIYLLARVIISLIINAVNFASPLPSLKRFDGCIGGGVAFLRGLMGMAAICMLVPIFFISSPPDTTLFSDIIYNSSIATYFYENNFLLGFISGVI